MFCFCCGPENRGVFFFFTQQSGRTNSTPADRLRSGHGLSDGTGWKGRERVPSGEFVPGLRSQSLLLFLIPCLSSGNGQRGRPPRDWPATVGRGRGLPSPGLRDGPPAAMQGMRKGNKREGEGRTDADQRVRWFRFSQTGLVTGAHEKKEDKPKDDKGDRRTRRPTAHHHPPALEERLLGGCGPFSTTLSLCYFQLEQCVSDWIDRLRFVWQVAGIASSSH